ncbi:hypothetical protein HK100_011412 [Physocladia obscura]|uniref:Uncharacterized protein n=1 Tax=Physocladia obscura TaxID=109957 RepID=A0AAD5T1X4_9FUNG|nr:hypothetical protein HK100_011412 [Physocladia obscura]
MGTPTPKADTLQRFLREWGFVSASGGTGKSSSDNDRILDLHSLELPRPTTSTDFTHHTSHALLTMQRAQQLAEEEEKEREREKRRREDHADSASIFADAASQSSNNINNNNINIYSTSYHSNSHSNKAPTIASNHTKKSFGRLSTKANRKAPPTAPTTTTIASFGSGIQRSLFGLLGKLKIHSPDSAEMRPLPPLPAAFSSGVSPSATITSTATSPTKRTHYYPEIHTNFHDGLATTAWDERSLPPTPVGSVVGTNSVAHTVTSVAPPVVKRRALPPIPISSNASIADTFDRALPAFPGVTIDEQKGPTFTVDINSGIDDRSLPRIPNSTPTPTSASASSAPPQTVNTTDAAYASKSQTQSPPSRLPPLHLLLGLNSASSDNVTQKDTILPRTSASINLGTPATPPDDDVLPPLPASTPDQQQRVNSRAMNSSLSFNDGDDSIVIVADNRKSYSFVMGYDDEIEVGKLQQRLQKFDEANAAAAASTDIISASNREMAISPFSTRSSRDAADTPPGDYRSEEMSPIPRSSIPSRAALHLFDRNHTFSDNLNDDDDDDGNSGRREYGYDDYRVSGTHQDIGGVNDDDRYKYSEGSRTDNDYGYVTKQEGMDSLTMLAKVIQQQHMNSKGFAS